MFAKSTHPAVVAAVTKREHDHHELSRRCAAFAMKHGLVDDDFFFDTYHDGSVNVAAFVTVDGEKPQGRWKRARSCDGWEPAANHPDRAEFDNLAVGRLEVPGYPSSIEDDTGRFCTHITGPRFVLLDGVVYAHIPFRSDDTDNADMLAANHAHDWVEVLESEWQHAEEVAYTNVEK